MLRVSGFRAVIEADRWVPGSYSLVVDGTPQSHVNLDDPTQLFFEYIQRMGHVIDQLGMPGEPITAVHLGAGAFTLPRYIHATRPGSRQQVIELEMDLVDLVREQLPLSAGRPDPRAPRRRPRGARQAARPGCAAPSTCSSSTCSAARAPPRTSRASSSTPRRSRCSRPSGIVLVNVADGPGLAFARSQAATLLAATGHVAALAETQILKGRRFGNVVLVGSRAPLPLDWMPRLLAGGPHPSKVVEGRELRDWIAGAPVVTDATAVPSPPPSKTFIQSR